MKWNEQMRKMREVAGYTIEEAAKELMCSVNALEAYENGERMPRDEVFGRMWKLYNNLD